MGAKRICRYSDGSHNGKRASFTARIVTVAACVVLAACAVACKPLNASSSGASGENPSVDTSAALRQSIEPYNFPHAVVDRVIDGDTIAVTLEDGSAAKVRLIGIDAPESVNPNDDLNTDAGKEASDYVKNLVHSGDDVWLESDVSDVDQYGRLLRYVWLCNPDTTDLTFDLGTLNAHLVYYGFANAVDYQPDVKHSATLHALDAVDPPSDGTTPIGPLKRR